VRVLLTGGAGMLGSSIAEVWPTLRRGDDLVVATRADADLTDRAAESRRR
jgi:GDP-L-fucose synthase